MGDMEDTGKCADRKKYWSEIKDSEKIERMRGVVKELELRVQTLNKIVSNLSDHTHNNQGYPVVRFDPYIELRDRLHRSGKDEVYF